MEKERKKPDLQHESLKQHPFSVPEGYFSSFPDRLKDRISKLEEDQVPVRKLGRPVRFRVAIAAAIVGLALISYPVIRLTISGGGSSNGYPDLTLLEEAGIFNNEYELALYLETYGTPAGEEEAYLNQAMEYLAMNDVEMDLIFE